MSKFHRNRLLGCMSFLVVGGMGLGQASPVAFPGAQGFGAAATGARGSTTVYHVTNLNDSGAGSFRTGVGTSNQTIVFDVGGYVQILSPVSVASNLTIAGQTAPGQGFGVFGCEVSFSGASNDIVRDIRFRDGDLDPNWPGVTGTNSETNCVNLVNSTMLILDHCSMEFGAYNDIDANPAVNLTLQNCLIADPILYQQFNFHLQGGPVTIIGNIFANALNRSVFGKANLQFVNNVVYNYVNGFTTENSGAVFDYDFINNNFIPGPSTATPGNAYVQVDNEQSAYATGNLVNGASDNTIDEANVLSSVYFTSLNAPTCPTSSLPMVSATTAVVNNLANSGALPRDQVDAQVVNQVASLGTSGSLFSTQTDTGLGNSGYGTITGGNNATDTDQDGMPDYWETAMGFNPSSAADGSTQASDGSGYTNLEEYLNWLAGPHSAAQENASVQIDLSQYTTGLSNPTYTVSALNTGTAILPAGMGAGATTNSGTVTVSGSMATFTPAANTVGLGGFSFTATAANGTISNTVYVCTTATTLPVQTGGGGGGGGPVSGTWQGGDETNGNWSDADNWNAGGAPGTTSGVASTAVATINSALVANAGGVGTWGNSATNPVVIDSNTQNVGGINFDTSAANYFIGSTAGNSLLLSSGGTIQILSTLSSTNAQETINAPLVLEGSYTLTNNSPNGTGAGSGSLNINGGITAASGVKATLTLSGGNTNNSSSDMNFITSVIGNGTGGAVVSLVKSGTDTWTLTGANSYTGTTTVSEGTVELGAGGTIKGGTTAVSGGGILQLDGGSVMNTTSAANLTGGQLVVNGGSLTVGASSNITAGSLGLFVKGGAATFSSGLTTDANGDTNWLIFVTGGTLTAASISMGRGYAGSDFTTQAAAEAGTTAVGLVINGGTVNITGALNMGTNSGTDSSVNAQLDNGFLTVGGTTTITDNNTRFSAIDVFGGTFTSNDTTGAGIKIGGLYAATSDELYVNGGTVDADKVSMGDSTQTSGTDILHLNAGALYVGTGGIVKGETSGSAINTVTLSGGTLGAEGNWSSSLNMALGGATIKTGNGSGAAFNISLSGVMSGTTLSATGGGSLTLSGANTYTGGTTIGGGTVEFNSTTAMPSAGVVAVKSGGTLEVMVGTGTGLFTNGTSGNGTIGGLLAGLGGRSGSTVTWSAGSALGLDTTNATAGFTYGGNITLAGLGLTKLGTGTLTLTGANSYTAATTVSSGELIITSNLTSSSSVSIASGATLDLTGANVSSPGTITNNGTLILGRGVTLISSGAFTNNGTLNLTNDPSYTLPVNFVNHGTVLTAPAGTTSETPTMPPWALVILALLLFFASAPHFPAKNRDRQ